MALLERPLADAPHADGAVATPAQHDKPRPVRQRTVDDVMSLFGVAVGSFSLTYVGYHLVLPLSGVLGFVICWYLVFLGLYAAVTAVDHPRSVVVDRLVGAVVCLAAMLVLFAVATVIVYTVAKGARPLGHLNFFTQDSRKVTVSSKLAVGGIKHVIVGTLIQLGLATAFSLPVGVATAVFMTEIGGGFTKVVRTVVEAMTAVPDLLAGLFVYTVLILDLGRSKNGLAVSLALSITMVPIIARSGEVALRIVPGSLREAALALGASQYRTVRMVVLPTARPQLATALILAVARAVGESAPLLIVSGESQFFNGNPLNGQTMNSLPLYIINGVRSGQPLLEARAFGAAVVLLTFVLVLFLVARYYARPRTTR